MNTLVKPTKYNYFYISEKGVDRIRELPEKAMGFQMVEYVGKHYFIFEGRIAVELPDNLKSTEDDFLSDNMGCRTYLNYLMWFMINSPVPLIEIDFDKNAVSF